MYTSSPNNQYFETLTEAKLELISRLISLPINETDKKKFIEAIQVSIEQHDNKSTLLTLIQKYRTEENEKLVDEITARLQSSPIIMFPEILNKHPTLGAADSFLPIQLLLNPTDKMTAVRDKVSSVILATLKDYKQKGLDQNNRNLASYFGNFAYKMIFESGNTYPGTFTLEEVNKSLSEPEKIKSLRHPLTRSQILHMIDLTIGRLESPDTQNYQIMAIHLQFGYLLLKRAVLIVSDDLLPQRDSPAYTRVVHEYNQKMNTNINIHDFMQLLRDPSLKGDEVRAFISDDMMYNSDFYQVESSRGRGAPDKDVRTQTLGLMRNDNVSLRQNIAKFETIPAWVDWSKCPYELNSKIVASMVSQETPFISSYSGTISILLNLLLSGKATTSEEQHSYLCMAIGYIAGVGYHSIHEILAPSVFCLDIIPRGIYPIDIPEDSKKFHPPHYNNFYQLVEHSDPDFKARRAASWIQLNEWYQLVYKVHHQPPLLGTMIEYAFEQYFENEDSREIANFLNDLGKNPLDPEDNKKLLVLLSTASSKIHKNNLLMALIDLLEEDNSIRTAIGYTYEIQENISAFNKLNSNSDLVLHYTQGRIHIIQRLGVTTDQYAEEATPLIHFSEKIHQELKHFKLNKEEMDEIITSITPSSYELPLSETVSAQIISHLKDKQEPHPLKFNWLDWVQIHILSDERLTVLKNTPDRKRIIVRNPQQEEIYKYIANRRNIAFEKDLQKQNKELFLALNPKSIYGYKVNSNVITITMNDLGTPLSEKIKGLSDSEWADIQDQAKSLIRQLHAMNYVHGDICIDNFVYNEHRKTLHLIDFETAVPFAGASVELTLFSQTVLGDINPKLYRKEDDLKLLSNMFHSIELARGKAANPTMVTKPSAEENDSTSYSP